MQRAFVLVILGALQAAGQQCQSHPWGSLAVFLSSGTIQIPNTVTADILLVGGGGGGGTSGGGGGGAGGVVYVVGATLPPDTYTITVGAGGAAIPMAVPIVPGEYLQKGGWAGSASMIKNSSHEVLEGIAYGGGGGGVDYVFFSMWWGGPGGSSGGGVYSGIHPVGAVLQGLTNNGLPGGYAGARPCSLTDYAAWNYTCHNGGGGGGAGGPAVWTDGGPGILTNITGTPMWLAGGGGGGINTTPLGNGAGGSGIGGDGNGFPTDVLPHHTVDGYSDWTYVYYAAPRHDGLPNTGSGGGGGMWGEWGVSGTREKKHSDNGGAGGSGIVIMRIYASDCTNFTSTTTTTPTTTPLTSPPLTSTTTTTTPTTTPLTSPPLTSTAITTTPATTPLTTTTLPTLASTDPPPTPTTTSTSYTNFTSTPPPDSSDPGCDLLCILLCVIGGTLLLCLITLLGALHRRKELLRGGMSAHAPELQYLIQLQGAGRRSSSGENERLAPIRVT